MPIIHSGPAQMVVAGPASTRPAITYLLQNDDEVDEIYLDLTPNVRSEQPGGAMFVLAPQHSISVDGSQPFWARTRPGTTAHMHVVPSVNTYVPAAAAPPVPAAVVEQLAAAVDELSEQVHAEAAAVAQLAAALNGAGVPA